MFRSDLSKTCGGHGRAAVFGGHLPLVVDLDGFAGGIYVHSRSDLNVAGQGSLACNGKSVLHRSCTGYIKGALQRSRACHSKCITQVSFVVNIKHAMQCNCASDVKLAINTNIIGSTYNTNYSKTSGDINATAIFCKRDIACRYVVFVEVVSKSIVRVLVSGSEVGIILRIDIRNQFATFREPGQGSCDLCICISISSRNCGSTCSSILVINIFLCDQARTCERISQISEFLVNLGTCVIATQVYIGVTDKLPLIYGVFFVIYTSLKRHIFIIYVLTSLCICTLWYHIDDIEIFFRRSCGDYCGIGLNLTRQQRYSSDLVSNVGLDIVLCCDFSLAYTSKLADLIFLCNCKLALYRYVAGERSCTGYIKGAIQRSCIHYSRGSTNLDIATYG